MLSEIERPFSRSREGFPGGLHDRQGECPQRSGGTLLLPLPPEENLELSLSKFVWHYFSHLMGAR